MDATELKAILAQHKLWIESGRKKGKDANLHSVNLQGAYLWGVNLRCANLEDANLLDANLRGANLQGATFDLNFKKIAYFKYVTFSEDQIAWVCLHPKYHEWASTLKWVKAERLSA